MSRVSGCVDVGEWTVECPLHTALDLTMYGLNFQRTALDITVGDHNIATACSTIRVSTDEQLRCTFNTSNILPSMRRSALSVSLNSSLGSFVLPTSVAVSDEVIPPSVAAVSGCIDEGRQTRDCTQSSELRLTGHHFPRWLPPTLVIAGVVSLPCQWRGTEAGLVYCSLDDNRVNDLPTTQLLPVQLRFDDRTSDAVAGLAMRGNSPPPPPSSAVSSSTGGGGDGVVVVDDLQSVKVSLFVLCVVALVALVGGAVVWGVGLWTAHRRAFVSANGQAAVDMRQVLLH